MPGNNVWMTTFMTRPPYGLGEGGIGVTVGQLRDAGLSDWRSEPE